MKATIVVRSKDEASRLRLALASLTRQTAPAEVVVVNDGSSDATAQVLADAARAMPVTVVAHATARGRSAAANAGARAARGDILLFLDGDMLAAPEWVERHLAVHAAARGDGVPRVARGENFHFRGTRFLLDPDAGTPRPGEEERVARLSREELDRLRVTREDVLERFDELARRAEPGIYPGAGPRQLQEIELDALRHHPECTVLWAVASGANQSVPRDLFLAAGGFDEAIDTNEHRELAYRLTGRGARMALAEGARTYHLTHRTGWRDPLVETAWERLFWRAHPVPAVKLLSVFWASLGAASRIPPEARIRSLPELEEAASGARQVDYDEVRRRIGGLPELPSPVARAEAR